MAPLKIPAKALEVAHQRLKEFRTRTPRGEWKAFDIVNADENIMQNFGTAHHFEVKFLSIMETKVRLPCIACQSYEGAIYCSVTYTCTLATKQKLSHSRLKPAFYCVMFPYESVFFSTRALIPEVISDSLIQMYGGTRLNKLPLEGRDFRSLRQLHLNKIHKGKLCNRPVKDLHPVDDSTYVEMKESEKSSVQDDVIEDEDRPRKQRKEEYFNSHFYPEKDPIITKFTVASSSKFTGARLSKDLTCDMKVTFRSDNLLKFFDYSMEKGILSNPLNPYLENIVNLGRTSISLPSQRN